MKKIKIVLACLLLICTSLTLFACQPNVEGNRNRQINSINHRGYQDAPENTLAAFRLSKEMGFDMVECDVRFTKDNVAVLLHDGSVNRTSDGKGNVSDMTFAEVRQLDFGSWKGEAYLGEQIPTFEEFVSLCVELTLYPYVEVKGGATYEQVKSLVDVVDEAGLDATWISGEKQILTWLADLRSGDRFGLITEVVTGPALNFLSELSQKVEVFVDTYYLLLTDIEINSCKSYGIPLEVWTVNSEAHIASLDEYVTGVTSDCVNAQTVFNNL